MLLTVFADRLLGSEQLTVSTNNLALAIQFLDYPLLVLQSKAASSAGTVDFKTGKAAAVDADDREVDFLLGHVPTAVLLLGVGQQSQPKLLATGNIELHSPLGNSNSGTHTVHKQNVILRDAEQQPVACAELYASLQPGNSVHTQEEVCAAQFPGTAPGLWGTSIVPRLQYRSLHPEPQQAQLQPVAPQLPPAPHIVQHWPADAQLQGHTHVPYRPLSPVVLEHMRMLDSNASCITDAANSCQIMSQRMASGKENSQHLPRATDNRTDNSNNRATSPSKAKRQAVSKDTVQAAALKASQLLASSRGSKAAVTANAAAARPLQQQGYQKNSHQSPDVWSPPPPRPYRKYLDRRGAPASPSTGASKGVTMGPRKTAQPQHNRKGMQQSKHQQMQHWHDSMQQQQQVHLPEEQHFNRSDSGETTSDDCIELDDISCSLSAVLDKEWSSNKQHGNALGRGSCGDTAAEAARAGGLDCAAAPPSHANHHPHNKENAADQAEQILVQPSLPAHWQLPNTQGLLPSHQQQQQQHQPAVQLQPNPQQPAPEQNQQVPAVLQAAAGHSCHSCAATLSAAAQLLQATQQAAANAQNSSSGFLGVQGTAVGRLPQQQQFQGGVSAATAVVWEMMTLMTLRAVMSQAVNSMANQLSSTVGQVLQQAMGGIGQLALNTAAATAAAAAGSAAIPRPMYQPPQPSAAAATAAALRNSRSSAQSAGTASEQQGRLTTAPAAAATASAATQGEDQLTTQQLKQQQAELHKQFEQLEALMVIRDDTSEDGSSSSTGSTGRSRHSRSNSRDDDHQGQTPGRAMRKTGSLSRSRSTEGPNSATAAGMVVRLRRTLSGRRGDPVSTLSRSNSGALARETAPDNTANDSIAASTTTAVTNATNAGAVDAGWLSLDAVAPVSNAVGTIVTAAAVATKRSSSGRITLPPIASYVRDASVEVSGAAAAYAGIGASTGYSSPSNMRQKLSVGSVDTTYSENYEEDFELPESPQPTSPTHKHLMPAAADNITAVAGTAAHAAAAALDMLHRSLPAVTATSPTQSTPGYRQQQQQQGYQGPVRRVSSGGSSGNTSWQRTSFKLDRRGSELPEIPEISEDLGSLDEDLRDRAGKSTSTFRAQQQQVGSGALAHWLSGGLAAEAGNGSGRRTSKVLDSLDTLADSIMEETLPPTATSLSGGGSLDLHTLSLPQTQHLAAAGARTMTAAMPANSTRRSTTAPGPTTTARPAPSKSTSTDKSQQQPQQQVPAARELNTNSSFMSVDSTLDDLLASSDFAMPTTASSQPAGTHNEIAGVSATIGRRQTGQSVVLGPSSGSADMTSLPPAQQLQSLGSRRLSRISSAAQRGLSNYDDVSFLSDDEEDMPTAPKQQEGRSVDLPGLDSGASFMSSLDGSDLDIEYSAVGAQEASYKPSGGKAPLAATSAARAPALASNRQSVGSAASTGSQKSSQKGAVARNAADVFYSHVSGTPSYLAGAAGASGRVR